MRRFFRILRAIFAGVSLILCVAAAGLWVRSAFVTDVVECAIGEQWGRAGYNSAYVDRPWVFATGGGYCVAGRNFGGAVIASDDTERGWRHESYEHGTDDGPPEVKYQERWDIHRLGIGYFHRSHAASSTTTVLVVHLAYVVTVFTLAPGAWGVGRVRRWRRNRRPPIGHCTRCGYDLRASPGRCPECGAVPAR